MLTSSSFKIHKLTRSMEMRTDSFTKDSTINTPRISAMNSVAKSVKYNNLSFMTGEELCKLRRQPEDSLEDPEYSTAHSNMANIRKRYDKTNEQKLYYDNKLQRLKEEKTKYAVIQKQYEQSKQNGKLKVTSLQAELQNIKLQLMDKDFQKKSIQLMAEVIVHDKIIYDKRKFDMNKHLNHLKFKVKTISEQHIHKNQQDDRVFKVYDKLINRLGNEGKQRLEHLNSMQSRVMEKQGVQNSSVLRKSQMGEIAEQAMTDRDPEQKQWNKVFMSHKFIQKMLKSKIQRQMQKFATVQQAFKNIKISTGVTDARTMVTKFLTKEQIYGDLLSKIAQNEKQIQLLKKEQENYLKEIKKGEEQINLMEVTKNQMGNFRQELKQADYCEEKRKKCDFGQQKLKQFLFKQYKQLNKNSQESPQIKDEDFKKQIFQIQNKDIIKKRFIEYLTKLSVFVEESSKLESGQNQKPASIQSSYMNQQLLSKVFRAKPYIESKLNITATAKQPVFSQTSNPKTFVQNFQEEEITAASDQVDTIQEQRANLMKSNQKFMKELKNKREQQKLLIVENLVKNTREKAAPAPAKKVQLPVE